MIHAAMTILAILVCLLAYACWIESLAMDALKEEIDQTFDRIEAKFANLVPPPRPNPTVDDLYPERQGDPIYGSPEPCFESRPTSCLPSPAPSCGGACSNSLTHLNG